METKYKHNETGLADQNRTTPNTDIKNRMIAYDVTKVKQNFITKFNSKIKTRKA